MDDPHDAHEHAAADRGERLRLFFRQARSALPAQMAMGVFMLYLAWSDPSVAEFRLAAIWFAALAVVSLGRLGLIHRHRQTVGLCDAPATIRMENLHARLAGLSGLCWGAVPWVLYQESSLALDYLTAAMVFGMAGSATATLAALPRAFSWFVWPAVVPFGVKAVMIGGNVYTTGAVVMIFGIFALTFFNRTVHRMIVDSIRLRRENADLVRDLQQEKSAVEEALRIKSMFLAGVSHDLKHPLNALGLYLGYVKAQPEGLPRALPGMEQALGDMGGLLSRLLDLSRMESGGVRPVIREIRIEEVFAHCEGQFSAPAREKALHLRFVPTRAVVEADPAMLQSIVDNLVSNAVRYTERGGIVVGVRHRTGSRVIEVWDSGPGIPAERLPQLFEAYRRFDDTHRDPRGYGLGLALAKKQCDLLGFRLSVSSWPGRGTVFRVEMPVTFSG
ncbi:MAG: HAMP domain-containing sensor histidine kinase [Ectothiorhodospiraceae bacterium]|jgi:signal transduction histidine kinase|nr:HAMP domain-containing sensor histidine kinase [Ectothiorhodospiraceae bacterium]